MKKRVAFHTLGCKLNFAESSHLARGLKNDFEIVDFSEPADHYVLNSCVVTAAAEKKCRAAIRQAHKCNPKAKITVVGCMSQVRAEQLQAMNGVHLVLGNAEKFNLNEFLSNGFSESPNQVIASNILKNNLFHPSFSGSDRTRTFVKIQDGCDYFCSYCTIPFARGRSRSNTVAETLDLIKTALNTGSKELILTGVNIGDFGKPHGESLYKLLETIESDNIQARIRLSSIEPDLLTDEIIKLVADSEKFMPHFHLPLQSGSDSVLKRMNRKYTTQVFTSRVHKIKSLMPHAFVAADVIAGFPGETETEFGETYELLDFLPVSSLHVFPYSGRPGTRSITFDDQINPEVIHVRVNQLLQLSEIKLVAFIKQNTGRTEEVLFESENEQGFISGFTRNYIRVKAPFDENQVTTVRKTRLTESEQHIFLFNPTDEMILT